VIVGERLDVDNLHVRPGEVAKVFGVTTETVAGWADRGLVPFTLTEGGQRRYRSCDITRLLLNSATVGGG
jgi:DNA-binding transcriptional MerR regulator